MYNYKLMDKFVKQYGPNIVKTLDELAGYTSVPADVDLRITYLLETVGLITTVHCKGEPAFFRTDLFLPFYEKFRNTELYGMLKRGEMSGQTAR